MATADREALIEELEWAVLGAARTGDTKRVKKAREALAAALAAPPVEQPRDNTLGEIIGCFDAAIVEGLHDALASSPDARLVDLAERRLMHAYYAAIGPSTKTAPLVEQQPAAQPMSAPDSERAARAKAMTAAQVAKLLRQEAVCVSRMNVWQLDRAAELLEAQPAPQVGAAEPWERIDDGTLVEVESTALSNLAHKAAFFPKDAYTLSNIALHCIREVRANRSAHPIEQPSQDAATLERIRAAINTYHLALDERQHGGIAANNALGAIQEVMGMSWVQGAAARAAQAQGGAA